MCISLVRRILNREVWARVVNCPQVLMRQARCEQPMSALWAAVADSPWRMRAGLHRLIPVLSPAFGGSAGENTVQFIDLTSVAYVSGEVSGSYTPNAAHPTSGGMLQVIAPPRRWPTSILSATTPTQASSFILHAKPGRTGTSGSVEIVEGPVQAAVSLMEPRPHSLRRPMEVPLLALSHASGPPAAPTSRCSATTLRPSLSPQELRMALN